MGYVCVGAGSADMGEDDGRADLVGEAVEIAVVPSWADVGEDARRNVVAVLRRPNNSVQSMLIYRRISWMAGVAGKLSGFSLQNLGIHLSTKATWAYHAIPKPSAFKFPSS